MLSRCKYYTEQIGGNAQFLLWLKGCILHNVQKKKWF
jgi:hypothetical protein